jgi:hypothetical protein
MVTRKYTTSIDDKIAKAEENVVRTKAKYTEAVKILEELMAKKKAMQTAELMKIFENSSRSYEEVVEFLTVGMTEEQKAKSARRKPGRKSKQK